MVLGALGLQSPEILLTFLGHLPQDIRRSIVARRISQPATLIDPSGHALDWVRFAHAWGISHGSRVSPLLGFARSRKSSCECWRKRWMLAPNSSFSR
jgi:pyrroloquinoline quinone (PQQ) biosynthesis protein C